MAKRELNLPPPANQRVLGVSGEMDQQWYQFFQQLARDVAKLKLAAQNTSA